MPKPLRHATVIILPGETRFTIGGPDASDLLYMVADALEFVGGPALREFNEYLDAKVHEKLRVESCDHHPEFHAANVARHAKQGAQQIRDMLDALP